MWKLGETQNWRLPLSGTVWYTKTRTPSDPPYLFWSGEYSFNEYMRYFYSGETTIQVKDGAGSLLLQLRIWAVANQDAVPTYEDLSIVNQPGDPGWEADQNYLNTAAWIDFNYEISAGDTVINSGYARHSIGQICGAYTYITNELWGQTVADVAKTFSLELYGTSEHWGERTFLGSSRGSQYDSYPWRDHTIDNDPCWGLPDKFWHAYRVKPGTGRYKFTLGGVEVVDAALPSSFNEAWNAPRLSVTVGSGDFIQGDPPLPAVRKVVEVNLPAAVNTEPETIAYAGGGSGGAGYAILDEDILEGHCNSRGTEERVDIFCPGYTLTMGADGTYLDGSPLVGDFNVQTQAHPLIGSGLDRTVDYSSTLAYSSSVDSTYGYEGWYNTFDGWNNATRKCADVYECTAPFAGVYCYVGWNTITDASLDDLGEPRFDDPDPLDTVNDNCADRRLLIDAGAPTFDALSLSVESEKILFTLDGTWTAHDCTITDHTGYITVAVTGANPYIEKVFDRIANPEVSFQGARFASLNLSTDSALPVTVVIQQGGTNERQYNVTPGKQRFDLLAPKNRSGFDYPGTRSMVDNIRPKEIRPDLTPVPYVEPTWGWGVHYPGKIRFTGFESGKAYSIEGLRLVKASAAEGGFIACVAIPQANWVGKAPGENSTLPAPFGPYEAGIIYDVEMEPRSSHFAQIAGYWIIDGVVAAEIIGGIYIKSVNSYGEVTWAYQEATISDTLCHCFPQPSNNFFAVSVLASPDTTQWANQGHPLNWLRSVQTQLNAVTVSAVAMVDVVAYPVNNATGETPGFAGTFEKRFRGAALLTVAGHTNPVSVHVTSGSGTLNSVSKQATTNPLGWLFTPATNMFDADTTIEVDNTTTELSTIYGVMNRTLTPITALGSFQTRRLKFNPATKVLRRNGRGHLVDICRPLQ